MRKNELAELRRSLPAVVLAVCCTHFYASSLDGQSEENAPKPSAVSRRASTEFTIEKLIDWGRLQEAREKLREQFAKEGERPRMLLFEAMILYKEKQYPESIRKLERSLALYDRDPDVYKLIGLNLVSLGEEDLAGRYFETAVELAPRDFMARYYLGLSHLTNKHFDRAETGIREVIKLNPKYVDAYILLGVAQEQLGKEIEAIRTYRQAIELTEQQNLKTETPFLYLGRLLISLQSYEQSLPPLQRAVDMNPKSAEARTLLGRALNQLGHYEEALQVLQDAVKLAPQSKAPHYLMMGIYKKLGKSGEAQREMQLFLELEEKERKK